MILFPQEMSPYVVNVQLNVLFEYSYINYLSIVDKGNKQKFDLPFENIHFLDAINELQSNKQSMKH